MPSSERWPGSVPVASASGAKRMGSTRSGDASSMDRFNYPNPIRDPAVVITTLVSLCKHDKLQKVAIGESVDPVRNPYSPGAGSPPPELAGRDKVREQARIAMARIQIGNPAKSVLMVGLRGVGKTVLLDKIRQDADSSGIQTIRVEAPEERSLPALLAPQLRLALLRMSRVEHAKEMAEK